VIPFFSNHPTKYFNCFVTALASILHVSQDNCYGLIIFDIIFLFPTIYLYKVPGHSFLQICTKLGMRPFRKAHDPGCAGSATKISYVYYKEVCLLCDRV